MNLHLQLEGWDTKYLPFLKSMLYGHGVSFNSAPISTITEVELHAARRGAKHVVSTSQKLLTKLLQREYDSRKPSLDNYTGSIIDYHGIEYLFIPPLEQLVTVRHGSFLFKRYLSKFLAPAKWFPVPQFTWEIAQPNTIQQLYDTLASADYIAQDIETVKDDLLITCSCYTGIWFDRVNNRIRVHSIVLPCKEEYDLAWIARFNQLPAPKIFQNGKYDNAYFLRWRAPVRNWKFDTINLFHSWYCELPKDLAFIVAFVLRKWVFWKEESNVPIHSEAYYRYNAKDGFTTALSFLALLAELPEYAIENYKLEFPMLFPCILAETTGIKCHERNFETLKQRVERNIDSGINTLRTYLGEPQFNSNSPPQCIRLWKVLGSGDIASSNTSDRDKVKNRHPLNRFIIDQIESIRRDRKLASSYFKDGITYSGRFLYNLNPHGTDTGRLTSQEHHFWCGIQFQNIPTRRSDIVYKECICADPGFYLGEGDFEQAESRDTAYITGDPSLLAAVNSSKDFHALNASSFFGVPYEKIVAPDGTVLDKELRDLSKRTNHGANYNMGARVMLDTMGIKNVLRAKQLLGLPRTWNLLQVTEHLLECFAKTYSRVKGEYQDWVKYQVENFQTLVGPTGWTRYCFGKPRKNKQDLNAYIAHCPQSLNAMTLNKAWWKVFVDIALKEPDDFKLCAQIHDSILFQYRIGRIDLVHRVYECMLLDTPVVDIDGISRVLRVPAAMKGENEIWAFLRKIKVPEAPAVRPKLVVSA
jgi:DNA polymerase I-like protein with 3'-5' exonuclease and polymerase domains